MIAREVGQMNGSNDSLGRQIKESGENFCPGRVICVQDGKTCGEVIGLTPT